ncbi:hypothetical protein glysoja_031471 [Glycine soja]|uniref:Uncharacterized protein n=1 Tax=Glycine soja TaxID=3848 RepID=A0A0B2S3Q1_GLYSO|nr:hypothetical protein glysoja_031471 [Glycine soja]
MRGVLPYTAWLMQMMWKGSVLKKLLTVKLKSPFRLQKSSMSGRPFTHSLHGQQILSKLYHMRTLYDIYKKPVELLWDGKKFGLPNTNASFFLTYSDVNEIILGDKCLNIAVLQLWMIAMKTLKTIVDGKIDQAAPQWIEVKSHVQSEGYECCYHVIHWMWNIVSGGLKNDWVMWFADGTPLDKETITTIYNKWAAYFVKVKDS